MQPSDELITIGDYLRWCATQLSRADVYFGHGTDNAWDEAVSLVCGTLSIPLDKLEFLLPSRLTRAERQALLRMLELRISRRVPVPYLTGETWFAGHRFLVQPGVLIPRSPIAELIRRRFTPWLAREPRAILDLCTGSGCIGIACAHAFRDADIVLADIDECAVQLTRRNVQLHQVDHQVDVVRSDLFEAIPVRRFDLIVANPPYVDADEFARMPAEYLHEPRLALYAGADGLDVVRRLIHEAPHWLSDDGLIVVEVGNSAEALLESYPRVPFVWPEFERGGHGVFVIDRTALLSGG